MSKRTALLLGASGLIGSECLDLLLVDPAYTSITTLGRRPLEREHKRLHHHIVDFDNLAEAANLLQAQDVFCCLGTTLKKAGSKEQFSKVDMAYPFEAARIALAKGAEQFLLVSALGADSKSTIFYNRVKGEAEAAITALPYDGVYIFRPSLLTGEREENRLGEQVWGKVLGGLSFALQGPLRKYRSIEGRTVAEAMMAVASAHLGGVRIYESDMIERLAAVGHTLAIQ